MPIYFHCQDFFDKEIHKRRIFLQKFLLNGVSRPNDNADVIDEAYKKPWTVLKFQNSSVEFGVPDGYLPICQHEFKLDVEDITNGLFFDNFNESYLLEAPLLSEDTPSQSSLKSISHVLNQVPISTKIPHFELELIEVDPHPECGAFNKAPQDLFIDKPILSISNTVEETPIFCHQDVLKQVEVIEEKIDFDRWNLNTIANHQPPKSNYFIKNLSITSNFTPEVLSIKDVTSLLSEITTAPEITSKIYWNPFKIPVIFKSLSTNFDKFNPLVTDSVFSTTSNNRGYHYLESFEEKDQPLLTQHSLVRQPKNCEYGMEPDVTLPKLAPLPNLDTIDSVDSFMMHRKSLHTYRDLKKVASCSPCPKPTFCHEVIKCATDAMSKQFVNRLFDYVRPFIRLLVSSNILQESDQFLKMNSDHIQFLYKQNLANNDKATDDALRTLATLTEAADQALQLSVEVGLYTLTRSSLSSVDGFDLLLRDIVQLQSKYILSGAISTKIKEAASVLAKESVTSLVLITKGSHVKSELIDILAKMTSFPIAPSIKFEGYRYYLLNSEDIIVDEFPWQRFRLIIEFNSSSLNLRHIMGSGSAKLVSLMTEIPEYRKSPDNFALNPSDHYKMIAYSSIDPIVLQHLEKEFTIYHRSCSGIHETLIIDEQTSVLVIQNLETMATIQEISMLLEAVSLRYSWLHIIIDLSSCTQAELFPHVVSSAAQIPPSSLHIHHHYAANIPQIISIVHAACQTAKRNRSPSWPSGEAWLDRAWLSEEETPHEKLLVTVPCVNAYVAQLMLMVHPITALIRLPLQEALNDLAVIPGEVIRRFYEIVRPVSKGVKAEASISSMSADADVGVMKAVVTSRGVMGEVSSMSADVGAIKDAPTLADMELTTSHCEDDDTTQTITPPDASKQPCRTVQFDLNPIVQSYSQVSNIGDWTSPQEPAFTKLQTFGSNHGFLRTSLRVSSSVDLTSAINETYTTPLRSGTIKIIKTPAKPKSVVKPMFCREKSRGNEASKMTKRQIESLNKYGFSFSKKRKVLIDKRGVSHDPNQTTLYIGE